MVYIDCISTHCDLFPIQFYREIPTPITWGGGGVQKEPRASSLALSVSPVNVMGPRASKCGGGTCIYRALTAYLVDGL